MQTENNLTIYADKSPLLTTESELKFPSVCLPKQHPHHQPQQDGITFAFERFLLFETKTADKDFLCGDCLSPASPYYSSNTD